MKTQMWMCAVLAAAISGCGSRHERTVVATPTAQAAPQPQQRAHEGCPMMVDPATTRISTEDTEDGIAIVFATSGDPAALREHVRRMAEMHDKMAAMHGDMKMVPSHATAEETDDGARIVIVPDDATQVAAVREQVRMHATMMARGECPMKEQMNTAHEHEIAPTGT